ncbi:MAG TPA: hypothetical protein VII06_31365 [Chloroflexota bacterium]|jgi:hypothetical protein
MTALEFWTQVNPDDTFTVPAEVAAQLPREQRVRVIILVANESEPEAWAQLTADQFVRGYAPGDAIYDELSAG